MTFESQLTRLSREEPGPGDPNDHRVEFVRYRGETRKPMVLWDRVKLLLLIALVWGVVLWSALSNDPLLSVRDAVIQQIRSKWWLEVLFGLELLRQVHYLISEHVSWWHRAWTYGVIGRLHARIG
jgi:cell division protease FtsH